MFKFLRKLSCPDFLPDGHEQLEKAQGKFVHVGVKLLDGSLFQANGILQKVDGNKWVILWGSCFDSEHVVCVSSLKTTSNKGEGNEERKTF